MKNYKIFWNGDYPLMSYYAKTLEEARALLKKLSNEWCPEEPYCYYEVARIKGDNKTELEELLSNLNKSLAAYELGIIKKLGQGLGISVSEFIYPISVDFYGSEVAPNRTISNSIDINKIVQIEIFRNNSLKIYYEYFEFGVKKITHNVIDKPVSIIKYEEMYLKPYGIINKGFFKHALKEI